MLSKNKTLKFTIDYQLDDKKKFIRIPFHVPDGIEKLVVQYNYPTKDNYIDLALESPFGFHGWSGTTEDTIRITKNHATPGYLPGTPSGKWQVVLGLAQIYTSGKIQIVITLYPSQLKWYCGDLHMHSIHSDGDYPVSTLIDHAKKEGLQFIALTDHNTFTQNTEILDDKSIVVIPTVELTTYKGHANLWNIKRPLSYMLCDQQHQVREIINHALEQKAVLSLNHPFCQDAWLWGFDKFNFKIIEIWNSNWKEGNIKCLTWWHNELKSGKIMNVVGGSDTHRKNERWYGRPTTWVNAESFCKDGILRAIQTGRSCVSESPKAPYVDLEASNVKMGQTLKRHEQRQLQLHCSIFNPADAILKLFSSEGLVEQVYVNEDQKKLTFYVSSDPLFYRVELWHKGNEKPLTISNPIYIR